MSTGAEGAKRIKSSMEATLEASIEYEKRRREVVTQATWAILDAVAFAGAPGCPREPLIRHLDRVADAATCRRVVEALEKAALIAQAGGKLRVTKSGIVEAQRMAAALKRVPPPTPAPEGETAVSTKTKKDPKGTTSVKDALIEAIERWPQKFRLRDPRGVTVRISPSESTVGEDGAVFCLVENKTGEKVKGKVSEARLAKLIIRFKTSTEPKGETTVTKTEKKAPKGETETPTTAKPVKGKGETETPTTAKPVKGKVEIQAKYEGKVHKAFLIDGLKVESLKGKPLGSPSSAAAAITDGKSINGWKWWKYEAKGGKLEHIAAIRAKAPAVREKKGEEAVAPKAGKKKGKKKAKVAAAEE